MHTATPNTGSLVLAPVSPAIAKLLHELQAQIIREAGERRCAEPDPMGTLWAPIRHDKADKITYEAKNGRDEWRRRRLCPPGWGEPDRMPWHPSHWLHDAYRVDRAGREWRLDSVITITPHVMDDFGALVAVGGAQ